MKMPSWAKDKPGTTLAAAARVEVDLAKGKMSTRFGHFRTPRSPHARDPPSSCRGPDPLVPGTGRRERLGEAARTRRREEGRFDELLRRRGGPTVPEGEDSPGHGEEETGGEKGSGQAGSGGESRPCRRCFHGGYEGSRDGPASAGDCGRDPRAERSSPAGGARRSSGRRPPGRHEDDKAGRGKHELRGRPPESRRDPHSDLRRRSRGRGRGPEAASRLVRAAQRRALRGARVRRLQTFF